MRGGCDVVVGGKRNAFKVAVKAEVLGNALLVGSAEIATTHASILPFACWRGWREIGQRTLVVVLSKELVEFFLAHHSASFQKGEQRYKRAEDDDGSSGKEGEVGLVKSGSDGLSVEQDLYKIFDEVERE